MKLRSPSFGDGEEIPVKFTCDGRNISPPLQWNDAPPGTKSFALICDDPDAPMGTWVHWVLFNLPAAAQELPEHVATRDALANGAKQGTNDFKRVGYGGPCPPPGKPHRYLFTLHALATELALEPRSTKADLLKAMKGHVLAETSLMGIYERRR
jgi:Raf kinase inhibitor-like YbhB/YbcL family protein